VFVLEYGWDVVKLGYVVGNGGGRGGKELGYEALGVVWA
jgi:hypothetical protein